MITSFTQLVAHERHVDAHIREDDDLRTQLVHCPYPNLFPEESECRILESGIERVVSIMHDVDHYATLEIVPLHQCIVVFDGLKRPLTRWQNHIVNILKRTKLIDREVVCRFVKKVTIRNVIEECELHCGGEKV